MKPCIALLAFLMVPPGTAAAQAVVGESMRLESGTRIRISGPGVRREGVLVEWRGDTALARIDASGEVVVIPPQAVAGIEVYHGTGSRAGKGAVIGGAIGMGAGLLLVAVAASDEWTAPTAGEAVRVVLFFTAVDAGIGALIGAAVRHARWKPLAMDAVRLQAGVGPGGRVRFGLRLGF